MPHALRQEELLPLGGSLRCKGRVEPRGVFRRRRATLSTDAGASEPESLEEGGEMTPTF